MYKEQLRSCEDLEDICDVRGFEQCRDDINMDVRIDKKDIKQAEGFDYVNYFNEEQASHCPKDCTNHAEFIITSFDKCCEQYSIENQSNMKNECEEECSKCYEPKNNCNYEPQCNDCYEIEDNCCYESKCNNCYEVENNNCYEEKCNNCYETEEKCLKEEEANCYQEKNDKCGKDNYCNTKKANKKRRRRMPNSIAYQKGYNAGFRMGCMRAQQEFRMQIMKMCRMFQGR